MKFSERQPAIGKSAGRRMERGCEKDSRSDGREEKRLYEFSEDGDSCICLLYTSPSPRDCS